MDVGASIGPFVYSLHNREIPIKAKAIYAIEPLTRFFPALVKNANGTAQIIPRALSKNKTELIEFCEDGIEECECSTFSEIIQEYQIDHIDFLKVDCEGGEYHIFSDENINWILKHVKYCVGEWHLNSPEFKENFKTVRDSYFKIFKRVEAYSVDGIPVTWDLYNDHFLEYYTEIIMHIEI